MNHWLCLVVLAALALPGFSQTGAVSFTLNSQGLATLNYGSAAYLGYGDFRVNAVQFKKANGQIVSGSLQATASMDTTRKELTKTYSWGSVKALYGATGSRFNLTVTIQNLSPDTLEAIFLEPLAVKFPVKPSEYDGNTPILGHNVGTPTVLKMTHGATALTSCNDDVTRPLLTGFPFAADRPASMLLYPLRINTGRDPTYPDSLPYINRSIAPGASDQYRVSFRFGSASTPTSQVAADVYASFAQAYPMRMNWTDRRPVGMLVLATAATGWPTNPRGWLLDPNINVTTSTGQAEFRTRVLAWADNAVRILKDMNAQGMITWDIEGEQFPHPTTYVGDSRQFAAAAPEMSALADEYFKKFRDAGLRVGVCLRPQQFVLAVNGSSAQQTPASDPAQLLIDKIAFARNRWGATLFYIDSNGDPSLPLDFNQMKRVATAHPDVLLVPEHENTAYFSIAAPYNELRGGIASTPEMARAIYPTAMSVINIADGPVEAQLDRLKTAVAAGDTLMFRAWFDDPVNALIKPLFPPVPDVEPPSVHLTAPGNDSQVSGTVEIRAEASDSQMLAGVLFLWDGNQIGPELASAPFAVQLRYPDSGQWSS